MRDADTKIVKHYDDGLPLSGLIQSQYFYQQQNFTSDIDEAWLLKIHGENEIYWSAFYSSKWTHKTDFSINRNILDG